MDCDGAHAIMNVESYRDMTHNDNKLPLSENECIHAKYLQRTEATQDSKRTWGGLYFMVLIVK